MTRFWGHFKTITYHKWLVLKNCFRVGLYWQGLTHDLSKYSPVEFIPGVKYYQGNRSPNDAQRIAEGCSSAWLHHKGRNRHHLEYWTDYNPASNGRMTGCEMPKKYVAEMLCDRIAASKVYMKENYTDASPWEYYQRGKDHYLLHPNTKALLEKLLQMLRDEGEEKTFEYVRKNVLKNKK